MSVLNKRLALMWYCKTPRGWYRFPALVEGDGPKREARVGWVMDRGQLAHYPEGKFQVRSWQDGKQVYQTLNAKHGRDAVLQWDILTKRAVNAAKLASGERKSGRLQTFKESAEAYAKDLQRENKLEAAEVAQLVLTEFQSVCKQFASIPAKFIKREDVLEFHAALRKRGLSERTIANKHNRIRSFLLWCKLDASVMPDAPRYEKRTSPTIYNPARIDAIQTAADEYRDGYMRLAIDMALMLGLREQELMHACWVDVDFHESTFRVTGKPDLGFAVKDAEERLLPIPAGLLARLQEQHDRNKGKRLILGTRNDAPNGHLLRSLKRLAQKAGLNCGRCASCLEHKPNELQERPRLVVRKIDPKTGQECAEWTLHKFRRTCLTTLLRQGLDARSVQHFAGHSDLDTTLRYLAPALSAEMQAKINTIQWGSGSENANSNKGPATEQKKRKASVAS